MAREERLEPSVHIRLARLERLADLGQPLDQDAAWALVDVAMRLVTHADSNGGAFTPDEIEQMHQRLQRVERTFHNQNRQDRQDRDRHWDRGPVPPMQAPAHAPPPHLMVAPPPRTRIRGSDDHESAIVEEFSRDWLGTLGIVAIGIEHNQMVIRALDPLMVRAVVPRNFRGYDTVVVRSDPIVPYRR